MALESTLTLCTQVLGFSATVGLPTTISVHDKQGEIYLSKTGVATTLASTTTSLTINPLAAHCATDPNYASVQEVNKAELYLESLTDDELANLCETTNLLIEEKEDTKVLKKV